MPPGGDGSDENLLAGQDAAVAWDWSAVALILAKVNPTGTSMGRLAARRTSRFELSREHNIYVTPRVLRVIISRRRKRVLEHRHKIVQILRLPAPLDMK